MEKWPCACSHGDSTIVARALRSRPPWCPPLRACRQAGSTRPAASPPRGCTRKPASAAPDCSYAVIVWGESTASQVGSCAGEGASSLARFGAGRLLTSKKQGGPLASRSRPPWPNHAVLLRPDQPGRQDGQDLTGTGLILRVRPAHEQCATVSDLPAASAPGRGAAEHPERTGRRWLA